MASTRLANVLCGMGRSIAKAVPDDGTIVAWQKQRRIVEHCRFCDEAKQLKYEESASDYVDIRASYATGRRSETTGETLREMGLLSFVFPPLDAIFANAEPNPAAIGIIMIVGAILMIAGILMETEPWTQSQRTI